MKLEINEEYDNKFLGRKEVRFVVELDGPTPSRKDMLKEIAAKLMVNPNLLVINRITSSYGGKHAFVEAYVYKDEETLKRYTPKYKLERIKEEEKSEENK